MFNPFENRPDRVSAALFVASITTFVIFVAILLRHC